MIGVTKLVQNMSEIRLLQNYPVITALSLCASTMGYNRSKFATVHTPWQAFTSQKEYKNTTYPGLMESFNVHLKRQDYFPEDSVF